MDCINWNLLRWINLFIIEPKKPKFRFRHFWLIFIFLIFKIFSLYIFFTKTNLEFQRFSDVIVYRILKKFGLIIYADFLISIKNDFLSTHFHIGISNTTLMKWISILKCSTYPKYYISETEELEKHFDNAKQA